MQHIGSLQGLFSDPTEWESKWEKIHSFWQEAHTALVPLGCDNFQQELDCAQIRATSSGACLGVICCFSSLIFTCIPACKCCGTRWTYFKKGILGGNVFCMLLFGLFYFVLGIYYHPNCVDKQCDDSANFTRKVVLLIGATMIAIGFCLALAFLGLRKEELTLKEKLLEDEQV